MHRVCSFMLMLGAAIPVHAVPISGLFGTGVDSLGALLPASSIDPHYQLIASADPSLPGPNAFVADPIPVQWVPNGATSRWIAPAPNQSLPGPLYADGNYIYRLTFDLTGLDPSTASLSGFWAADNGGQIVLNGVSTGLFLPFPLGHQALMAFSLTSGFVSGLNHLDFVVTNCCPGNGNPTGLRVDSLSGTANAAVPDPPTASLIATGLCALVLAARRRRSG